jgi:hypothetical protein
VKSATWTSIRARIKEETREMDTNLLDNIDKLDELAAQLQDLIHKIIHEEIPKAKPSSFARMSWSPECSKMVKQIRALKRQWSQDRTEESRLAYLASSHAKRKQIKRDKNKA